MHRDIKAANVFLDADMDVKLGDFGLAAVLEPSPDDASLFNRRTTFCGTPNYVAPEILSRTKGHATAVDIWALGVLLFYLAVGCAPFHAKNREDIYKKVKSLKYAWPSAGPEGVEENEIPEALKELVMEVLVEEELRPNCRAIVEHSFFRDGFIPERIDPLARSRRPRWARGDALAAVCGESVAAGDSAVNTSANLTYDALVAAAFVKPGPRKRGRLLSVLMEAERELAAGVILEVPLAEDAVYQRWELGQTRGSKRKKLADETDATETADANELGARKRAVVEPPVMIRKDIEVKAPAAGLRSVRMKASESVAISGAMAQTTPAARTGSMRGKAKLEDVAATRVPDGARRVPTVVGSGRGSVRARARAIDANASAVVASSGKKSVEEQGDLAALKRRALRAGTEREARKERTERSGRILTETTGNRSGALRRPSRREGEKRTQGPEPLDTWSVV